MIPEDAMNQWQKEQGIEYDVPDIVQYLADAKVLEDVSWHNDACPSFVIMDPHHEDYGIRLWVDHPLLSLREGEGKRFGVQLGEMAGEADDEIQTDDLEEALVKILNLAKDPRFNDAVIRTQPWWSDELSALELMEGFRDYARSEQHRLRKDGKGWRPR